MAKATSEVVDEPIPHATAEVYWHCLKKGAQLGSVVTLLTAPVVVYFRGGRGKDLVLRTGRACAIGTVVVGPLFAEGMALMRLKGAEPIAVYDRAYRIRHNKGQVRTDLFSGATAAASGLVGMGLLRPRLQGAVFGAAFGVGLGVLLHVLTAPKEYKPDN